MEANEAEYCLLWVQSGLCMPSSDWAAWVQAVFSVLAVFAAIGLVSWERLEARTHARAAAKVFASGMLVTVSQSLGYLAGASELLGQMAGKDDQRNAILRLLTFLENVIQPSNEELMTLVGAIPTVAQRLVLARQGVEQVRRVLRLLVDERHSYDNDYVAQQCVNLGRVLDAAVANLRIAKTGIGQYVDPAASHSIK